MSRNRQIALLLEETADLMEFLGEDRFRANAFRNAARGVDASSEDVDLLAGEGRLKEIQGVGKGIADRIGEFLQTGAMRDLEELRKRVPPGLLALTRVQGIGPKTLLMLYRELGIKSLDEIKQAIDAGRLASLPGMGAKKIENIQRGLEFYERSSERLGLAEALQLAGSVVETLRQVPGVRRLEAAGSLRRWKETIGDIDVVCSADDPEAVLGRFATLDLVADVLGRGPTKASVRTERGRQVDLRVVADESYGAALLYFTGSKAHNIKLREMAQGRGLKINEYGVFRGEERVAGREEEDVYASVGLPWIPPELREDTGEIEAAREGRLPKLVTLEDVRGDLHVHSDWSDGTLSIETVVRQAKQLGYRYVVISDHSRTASYAGGLTPERLREQWEEIRRVRKLVAGIEILAASEVDILADGTLDFPDEVLRQLDWVTASIHSGFRQNVTERMRRAMQNPYVDVIAHPTGRILSRREGYDIDLEPVIAEAARTGTALEINCYPERLDLSDTNARRARDRGVPISLGTDSHHAGNLEFMEYGVRVARRAGLTARDILNCREAKALQEGRKRWRGAEEREAGADEDAPAAPRPAVPGVDGPAAKRAVPKAVKAAPKRATKKVGRATPKRAAPAARKAASRNAGAKKAAPKGNTAKKAAPAGASPRRAGRKGPSSRS